MNKTIKNLKCVELNTKTGNNWEKLCAGKKSCKDFRIRNLGDFDD